MFQSALGKAASEQRAQPRDEVHHRCRATGADGRALQLLVVNISARGLMARCPAPVTDGERVRVQLPVLGWVSGTVRWSLGGRFGCELDDTMPLASYMMVLAAMVAQG